MLQDARRVDPIPARSWGWGFSTSQDFSGEIALIAFSASCWTPAMVRRRHADPFGFLRPWKGGVPALLDCSIRWRVCRSAAFVSEGNRRCGPRPLGLGARRDDV
jgi:hypothetical protein